MHETYDLQFGPKPRKRINSRELLELIFGYVARMANEKNLDNLLMMMADLGKDMIVADRCTLWLLDREKNELWTRVAHGVNEIRIPANTGLVGYSIDHDQPLFIDNAYNDHRFNPDVDKKTGYRTKAIIVIPLKNSEGETIGAYQAINKMTRSKKFTSKDLEYLTLAASYSGKSLEAALLNKEIEETQKEIIFTMGEIGESRSKETGNHIKRVAEYSKILALKYGMDETEAELLRIASPMHDIGKVAIPDSILKKPGKLTDEEFDTMKTHTQVGYNLLKGSSRRILKAAAIVARQHHEKWNGRGYPDGVSGEQIHIYGRVTAIADVFDALGSDRCYKKAWELDRILNLFKEEKGNHFDPVLVDLFLDNIGELVKIRDRYRDEIGEK
ncbi:HD-GYP domain-containing protein [Desulfocucumis palustris]|nr:HD domain-containing phosphohydrolase [Desulfocucumis palustris]